MKLGVSLLLALAAGLSASPVLAQLAGYPTGGSAPEPQVDLSAAAESSPRPAECAPSRDGGPRTHWDRARRPAEGAYCDALARGYAVLGREPARSLDAAHRAEQVLPGKAAPAVLEGRALLELGDPDGAWRAFERAKKISRRSLQSPSVLHAVAAAAYATGRHDDAVKAYRSLVPRAGLLPEARQRQRVYVEAALVVMAEGKERLDEAIGYLAEARRAGAASGLGDVALGALALALDRQGRVEEARGVAAEAGGPFATLRLLGQGRAARPLAASDADLHAIAAILAERKHSEIAKREWKAFVESEAPTSPWREHAKKKLEGGPAKPKPRQR